MAVGRIKFAEFIQYVVDTWSSGKSLNRHWRPQHELCRPCEIKYDFVGRYENLMNDAELVLANLTAYGSPKWKVAFPHMRAFRGRIPVAQERHSLYANISRDNVNKLIRIYEKDYQLFGYDYHWVLR